MSRNRSATTPAGDPSHPNYADWTHGWTFHSGASVVAAVKGSVTGTISGAGLTQSATTGLTNTNQARFVTLSSAITLTPPYTKMWRSKTTGTISNSFILSRSGLSQRLMMNDGSTANSILFWDNSAFVWLDSAESLLDDLMDYCLTVNSTTTKLYSKLATDTTWTLRETATRTGNAFTFDTILDGTFGQSNVGELHYLNLFNGKELTATDLLNFDYPYSLSTPDTTAPVVGTCTIPTSGTYIEVPFTDESLPILPASISGAGGITVSATGGAVTVTTVLRVDTGTLRLLLSRIILPNETVTWSYSGSTITDSADTENALGTVTNQAVTNGSTATGTTSTVEVISGRVERSIGNIKPIIFPWQTPGASLTGTREIDLSAPEALSGDLVFLRTVGAEDRWYLEYHEDDRPIQEGSVVYRITDGVTTKQILLDVTSTLTMADVNAGATVLSPVTQAGKLATIVIGDDYLAAYGRAFQWTIDAPTGFVLATSTCSFGGEAERGTSSWLSAGTITDAGSGRWVIKFDLTKTQTSALTEGLYKWSVEVKAADNTKHTVVRWGEGARVVEKQT